jgi:oligoendopeptidase F
VEQGIPLTAELLNKKYYELNKLYYGPTVDADKDIELEWARIPHFHYNFYVYKYATGMSAALKLAANLRTGKPELREAYLGFLKAGSSKDVLDILQAMTNDIPIFYLECLPNEDAVLLLEQTLIKEGVL